MGRYEVAVAGHACRLLSWPPVARINDRVALDDAPTSATPLHAAEAKNAFAPLPGYWEMQNTWVFVLRFKMVDHKCFSAADVGNVLQGPSNAQYTCTYPVRRMGDGRLSLRGTCVETHGRVAQVKAEGTYEPTAFQLKVELQTKLAGLPLKGSGSTVARRLSDTCPAEPQKGQSDKGR